MYGKFRMTNQGGGIFQAVLFLLATLRSKSTRGLTLKTNPSFKGGSWSNIFVGKSIIYHNFSTTLSLASKNVEYD